MLEGLHGHAGHESELKQQGVIEAARDPHTSVTAEDAETRMLKEAKGSGAAAFQFDPNATAAEKAQQAKAVRPFYRPHLKETVFESANHNTACAGRLKGDKTAQSRRPCIRSGTSTRPERVRTAFHLHLVFRTTELHLCTTFRHLAKKAHCRSHLPRNPPRQLSTGTSKRRTNGQRLAGPLASEILVIKMIKRLLCLTTRHSWKARYPSLYTVVCHGCLGDLPR